MDRGTVAKAHIETEKGGQLFGGALCLGSRRGSGRARPATVRHSWGHAGDGQEVALVLAQGRIAFD
ncbi:MAG: hypothetical protein U0350_31640 [Caldilineaceae bacterium]